MIISPLHRIYEYGPSLRHSSQERALIATVVVSFIFLVVSFLLGNQKAKLDDSGTKSQIFSTISFTTSIVILLCAIAVVFLSAHID